MVDASAEGAVQFIRDLRPPYVAFASFDAFLQRMRVEDLPERVNAALLNDWSIARGNESSLLTSLRSLGIIDDDDRPTDLYMPLRLSAQRRAEALHRAAIHAYPGLVDNQGMPRPMSDDEVHDHFVEHRGLRGQMADKATRFYRNFCALLEAERPAAPQPSPTVQPIREAARRAPTALPAMPPTPAPVVLEPSGAPPIVLNVAIPANATEAELVTLFRRIRRAWQLAGETDGE